MKIMLSAGEPSGDLNASFLARELKAARPEVELFGMGGPQMAAQGVRILEDPTAEGIIGFWEGFRALPRMKKLLARLESVLRSQRPDCLVLVDFPGFNMQLAKKAHSLKIPVVYYFAPSAWVWGRGRAEEVAKYSQLVLSVFPPEAEVFQEAGANVSYIGHPLVDIVKAEPGGFKQEYDFSEEMPLVALLPGSRPAEIKRILPQLLAAAWQLKKQIPSVEFMLSLSSPSFKESVQMQVEKLPFPITILEGDTYRLLTAADAAVIAVGTATLEAALLGVPMVLIYRIGFLTGILARALIKTPYVGLPNILLGEEVAVELLQEQACGERIAQEVIKLLLEDNTLRRQKLLSLKELLGSGGAVRRGAREIINLIEGGEEAAYSLHSK